MLFLLRKIRRKLMESKKITSYLLYAIGEIFLVVIGILIAVSLNNWNQKQHQLTWQDQFLSDLDSELKQDEERLSIVLNWQKTKDACLNHLLKQINTQNYTNVKQLDSLYGLAISSNRTFFPSAGVYQSAVSSGNIEFLTDANLKYQITNLYDHHYFRLEYNGQLYDNSADKIDWEQRLLFDKIQLKSRNPEVFQSIEFKANVEYLHDQNKTYKSLAEMVLQAIQATRLKILAAKNN